MPTEKVQYEVICDTREKNPWIFSKNAQCLGTTVETLKTGDYTLRGFEDRFVVERKASPSELAGNLTDPRFERELVRLATFKHAFVVLEFGMSDVINFPKNSGIPPQKWKSLRMTSFFFLRRLNEVQVRFPTIHFVFVGPYGLEFMNSICKRIIESKNALAHREN